MAMRSQVWKWDNMQGVNIVDINAGVQDSIFIGVFGTGAFFNRSITKPAETTATQFVGIEDTGCPPTPAPPTPSCRARYGTSCTRRGPRLGPACQVCPAQTSLRPS